MAKRMTCIVSENIILDEDHHILKIKVADGLDIKPGQFFMLRAWNINPVLNRPLSVFDYKDNIVQFFIRKKGIGTEIFYSLKEGDKIFMIGPSGNGFKHCEDFLAVGAGMGIAPVNYASTYYNLETICAVNSKVSFFDLHDNDFNVYTLDGTLGDKGNALEAVKKFYNPEKHKGIIACGPDGFLNILIEYCKKNKIHLKASFEERMGCGTGLCMSCAKKIGDKIIKICQDGPVIDFDFS